MERGQIFSLDFLISMVVITAAIALLLQATEYNTYNMKEERIYNEMRNVARISANLIVSSNETTCENGVGTGEYLMNCVDLGGDFTPIETFLDDSDYEYEIKTTYNTGTTILSSGISYNGEDFIEVKRSACVDDLTGVPEDITVMVWKSVTKKLMDVLPMRT